jgi:aconitate hydratase
MSKVGKDSLGVRKTLSVGGKSYDYFSLEEAGKKLGVDVSTLPFSMKVVLENLLRFEDGGTVTPDDVKAAASWGETCSSDHEIAYRPARVLMQDFTGVPAVVDLAAMRDAMTSLGGDPQKINPLVPVDLVIDHSVQVDKYGNDEAFKENVEIEMQRNRERYEFLRWGQNAFDNFSVVPPGTGICHQVNLEYLARVIWTKEEDGSIIAYPDTVVGTDSHTTMINGLAVLGWGVGGIEAESAMLGQPISMLLPEVVGFKLTGKLKEGATATDVVLTVTQMLREKGVVGKFVEFYGEGLNDMPLADRATIANMAPEYGATCGFFPVDKETITYMKLSARDTDQIGLVEEYAKAQMMWHDHNSPDPVFTDTLELDISTVEPCISGPKRPQDKILLSDAANAYKKDQPTLGGKAIGERVSVGGYDLGTGDVVIAAITSCTNTSNPSVMLAAGIVAKKAVERGISVKPWVKTSLAPGSKVVTEYLESSGLEKYLDQIGFNLVGYGCTTCIGNSGPLKPEIEKAIKDNELSVCSVLSGNRNFEGRVHPLSAANYLASPPLVVAYAIAGSMAIDISTDAIAKDKDGNDVYLKDIWPSNAEIAEAVSQHVTPEMFAKRYADVFTGDEDWQAIAVAEGNTYAWPESTYIKNPPYFEGMTSDVGSVGDIKGASVLALLGDSITTDHISPAGSIAKDGPAAKYLQDKGVEPKDFNSFGARRGNDDVMVRGTFANIRIKNEMAPGTTGGYTTHIPSGEVMFIYDAAEKYKASGTPLVVVGGKDYGMGSSRDWAAKGTLLLGVKAVITESFERIHRSNLVGMGVLPLNFKEGETRTSLGLDGSETFDITGLASGLSPKMEVDCKITYKDGKTKDIKLLCRLDTADEVEYYQNGGILHKVLRSLNG